MEVFSAFGLVMLVGLALPILFIISALLFDLAVVVYVLITTRPGHVKRSRGALLARDGASAKLRRIAFNH